MPQQQRHAHYALFINNTNYDRIIIEVNNVCLHTTFTSTITSANVPSRQHTTMSSHHLKRKKNLGLNLCCNQSPISYGSIYGPFVTNYERTIIHHLPEGRCGVVIQYI